jgi:outer membrane protein insertion porin family
VRVFLLALFGLPFASPARAEAPEIARPSAAQGTVANIKVSGLSRVEEAAIRTAIQLRTGEELADWKIDRDIKAIYATGFVDDVWVDAVPVAGEANAVDVTFVVDEKPAIREVKIAGNKKIDEDSLKEAVDITAFSVLNESDINENVQRIRDKYVEKGYYLVDIEPVTREVGDDQVELTFQITENRKVLVQSIDITGNEHIPDRKIRRYMQTKQAGIIPWLTNSGTFDETNLDTDREIIKQVFLEEGYVDVKVEESKVYLSPDKRFIYITTHVEEGPQYTLGTIAVTGDFTPEEGLTLGGVQAIIDGDTAEMVGDRWRRAKRKAEKDERPVDPDWDQPERKRFLVFDVGHPPLRTGDTFKLSTFSTTLQEVSDLYGNQGYAFVNVVPNTNQDPEKKIVDIEFDIAKGQKVRIGHIDITGNDPTYDKVVRREIPINEGEIYRQSAIKESKERLERLGYFEEVKISTPKGSEADVLDMKVEVTEQPTGSFSVGAGFSNLEDFVFTANVSKNNFLGLGYVMSAAVNLSKVRQQGDLSLYDPYFLDSRWTFNIHAFSISRQFIEDEYQRGGNIAIGRYLDPRDDIRLVADYTFEDTGLSNIDSYKQRLFGGKLYRNGITSTAGLSLNIDKRNNRINATRGIYTSLKATLSGGFRSDEDHVVNLLGGDFNMYELNANFRAFQPVSPKGDWIIFKYNGTLGKIGSTDGSIVPYIHRYRAGGINSVRGYDWYTLGPSIRALGYVDRTSNSRSLFIGLDDPTAPDDRLVIGGTETWINNFELEEPIFKQAGLSTVLFFDAGNAFGDPWGSGHINPLELRCAYGFGIRWLSPMGPLRFEWGFPINPYEDERKVVFDFSIGSLF